MRGDVSDAGTSLKSMLGSPPRARGRRDGNETVGHAKGLTPACAGTSPGRSSRRSPTGLTPACAGTSIPAAPRTCPRWAHPRVRGDVRRAASSVSAARGSPPRARGRRLRVSRLDRLQGLTPACAGTSWYKHTGSDVGGGSPPRARGRPMLGQGRALKDGLTPACAGTSSIDEPCPPVMGLTPACAGTSQAPSQGDAHGRAHPRVRGDVGLRMGPLTAQGGSPPRARGRPRRGRGGPGQSGLTPACAGTSSRHAEIPYVTVGSPPRARGRLHPLSEPRATWAHPRVRGDVSDARCQQHFGSGLTPACAGTSTLNPSWSTVLWAHPRVRGDVLALDLGNARLPRAHPRVRGDVCFGRGVTAPAGAHPRVRGDVSARRACRR